MVYECRFCGDSFDAQYKLGNHSATKHPWTRSSERSFSLDWRLLRKKNPTQSDTGIAEYLSPTYSRSRSALLEKASILGLRTKRDAKPMENTALLRLEEKLPLQEVSAWHTTLERIQKAEKLLTEANERLVSLQAENESLKDELQALRREHETARMEKSLIEMEEAEVQLRRNLEVDRLTKNRGRRR